MPQSRKKEGAGHGGEEVRLQTYLAKAGIASRRASEALIAEGRVFVNGHSVTAPGTKVRPGVDRVEVNGEPVEEQPVTWVALHKPRGYVTSRIDQYGRKTVYDLLPDRFHGLFHVGRLDRDSEGILLLTNDGNTANRMLHPSYGTTKEYLADVEGRPASELLHRLVEGVEVDGETMRAESAKRLHQVDVDVFRIQLVLQEGKKREVRRMLESVGHPVVRLIRRRFGPVELGELPSGKWRVLASAELSHIGGDQKPRTKRARAVEAEPESDAPRAERPRPRKAETSRPRKSDSPRPSRPGARSASSRPERAESDRPSRAGSRSESDRPSRAGSRSESDRPSRTGSRSESSRPPRSDSRSESRPPRDDSPRPARGGSSRPPRDESARPARGGASRPPRDESARPARGGSSRPP
ncbi:MAG TPA: pseudouridine synthase, partial [Longimicrobium sp.]|nr:pseudouridine synthase [Longimicrobium sp.]